MRSVLIQVAEIIEAIQLRVVVVDQVELVVAVVGWLAPLSGVTTSAVPRRSVATIDAVVG